MRSYGRNPPTTGVFIREDNVKSDTENTMGKGLQRWEWCIYKPKYHQGQPELDVTNDSPKEALDTAC
jgi:hypothetical protein